MRKGFLAVPTAVASLFLFSCFSKTAGDAITVVSREASSGTRTAFDEMIGVSVRNGSQVTDNLFSEALISGSSGSVSMTVASEPNAIGYTSLVSVGSTAKVLSINGVIPSAETLLAGEYPLNRPFLLAVNEKNRTNPIVEDFMNFISSKEGADTVAAGGYVSAAKDAEPFVPAEGLSGKIVLSGSTSTEPVVSKLQEVYKSFQPDVQLEIQYVGSTAGLKDVASEKAQIGLSSRDLTAEELLTLQAVPFAYDAIAVIVHKNNPLNDITTEQLKAVYTGEIRNWSALSGGAAGNGS